MSIAHGAPHHEMLPYVCAGPRLTCVSFLFGLLDTLMIFSTSRRCHPAELPASDAMMPSLSAHRSVMRHVIVVIIVVPFPSSCDVTHRRCCLCGSSISDVCIILGFDAPDAAFCAGFCLQHAKCVCVCVLLTFLLMLTFPSHVLPSPLALRLAHDTSPPLSARHPTT